jgi:aspartyl-tRNA(Asn)/glutamyl-tRNA(Gln) amidotransferase subunit C
MSAADPAAPLDPLPDLAQLGLAEIEHLAQLSRLELSAEEKISFLGDLNKMLGYFRQLQELDTEGVPEMQRPISLVNVTRPDVPGEMFSQQTVLDLAPESQDGFIRVPRTVEQ